MRRRLLSVTVAAAALVSVTSGGCTFTEDFDRFTAGTGAGGQVGSGGAGGAGGSHGGSAGSAGSGGVIVGMGDACTVANSRSCAKHADKSILACDPSTLTWKLAVVCSGNQLCDSSDGPNAGSCQDPVPACVGKSAGDVVCDGASRVACGIDLVTSTALATCVDAEHCAASTGNTCALCVPGEHQCKGKDLYACTGPDAGFALAKSCDSAALCDATGGVCKMAACVAKSFSCNGDMLRVCKDDGSAYVDVMPCSAGACDAKAGKCDSCAPGSTGCKDAKTLLTCGADGQTTNTAVCPAATPVCAGTPAACVQCAQPSDCPAPSSPCQSATCTAGVCGTTSIGAGMPAPTQTAGDCQKVLCDSAGKTMSVADNTDAPKDDGNPCTDDVCQAGKAAHPPKAEGTSCATGACVAGKCAVNASCAGLAATCGPSKNESCCASLTVMGGTFGRSWDASNSGATITGFTMSAGDRPATLGNFGLDKYEVTVGRFRAFLEAFPASTPVVGAGAKMANGTGYPGWQVSFDSSLPADAAGYLAKLKTCTPDGFLTFTDAPAGEENAPMNCVTWFDATAFCAWDGGRLPTEAEWNYAAAGGAEQRAYPWSVPAADLSISSSRASYSNAPASCTGDGMAGCVLGDLAPVGSFPMGAGKYGHLDLAGNVQEWVIDSSNTISSYPPGPCADCALYDSSASFSVMRGGAFDSLLDPLRTAYRVSYDPELRRAQFGIRCVH